MEEINTVYVDIDPKLDSKTLKISSRLVGCYPIMPDQNISIRIGKLKEKFSLYLVEDDSHMLAFNPQTLNRLALSPQQKYNVKINKEEIRLGPVVAIMADLNKTSRDKPFGGQSSFIKQAIKIGQGLGELCFAFSPYSIDWKKKKIRGYTIKEDSWIPGVFPFPDVIYPRDRMTNAQKMRIRKRLSRNGISMLTSSLLDKWETYKILSEDTEIKPHLPDTRLVVDFGRQVDNMLNKYGAVYLKPIGGEQGKNIIKVIKKKNGIYQYWGHNSKQPISGQTSSITELYLNLKSIMMNRKYIVQKEINLIRWQNKIIDVRVLVQKSYGHQWHITGIACRIGGNGAIASNISCGGTAKKLEEVLKFNFEQAQIKYIVLKLQQLALKVARVLEFRIGNCGEMGIDLGIDKKGKIWFIEANLRPARQVFTLMGENETRIKSITNPMLYAKYLGGF
ncbi:YheC/D like ATP-grasp [Thermosyntropha lipolytica DSM 11003]|uniref:YheC/D like ATP-grasp n=1 Tax=Thermosyntropha lipolytica DSM 11003 TaxID=1123382 RepID=A0A1M5LB02_9FIRM|nr:YheC/YheD family protein [Thermosyntropha lipolytica]SHG62115.1 YheC/D like ATP-grasp [Thermosyntropha lipolytica DSM 11003]